MKIRWRPLGLLILLVLFIVDGLLILQARSAEQGVEEGPLFSGSLFRIDIRLPQRGEETFIKSGDFWHEKAPSPGKGQVSAGERALFLAEHLTALQPERLFDNEPQNLRPFGLDDDNAIWLRFSDGAHTETEILLGARLPLDILYVYALIKGRTGVFKIPAAFRDRILSG